MKWNIKNLSSTEKSYIVVAALLVLIMVVLTGDSGYSNEAVPCKISQNNESLQSETVPQEALQEALPESQPAPEPQESKVTETPPDDEADESSQEPEELLPDPEPPEEHQTNPLVMTKKEIEKELLRIRAVWTVSRNEIDNGRWQETPIPGGGKAFFDYSQRLDTIQVSRKTDFVKNSSKDSYTRIFQFEDGKLIFAFYTEGKGGVAYRLYFKDGWMFRLRYAPNATVNGNYTDFDLRTDMEDYNTWQEIATKEANELYAMATK